MILCKGCQALLKEEELEYIVYDRDTIIPCCPKCRSEELIDNDTGKKIE